MLTQNCSAFISGAGSYLPSQIVHSADLMHDAKSESVGIPVGLLERSTGIAERRFSNGETYAQLATEAARAAIIDARINPLDIDAVIFCGIDNEYPEPSTAHEVQREVGARNAICFDLSNACLGLLNGLSVADSYITSGTAENILVCTGERPSDVSLDVLRQLQNNHSKDTFRRLMGAFTVGDAGGAFVVTRSGTGPRISLARFHTDSDMLKLCFYRRHETHIEFEMEMETLGKVLVSGHKDILEGTYSKLGWVPDDIGTLYSHQVGARPHRNLAAMVGVTEDRAPKTFNKYGNLTSATFAVNFDLHRPSFGKNIMFMGAGSGCSICQMGLIWETNVLHGSCHQFERASAENSHALETRGAA